MKASKVERAVYVKVCKNITTRTSTQFKSQLILRNGEDYLAAHWRRLLAGVKSTAKQALGQLFTAMQPSHCHSFVMHLLSGSQRNGKGQI